LLESSASLAFLTAVVLAVVILLALFFVYSNGFQDGSSVAATAISCRALSPLQAIALVATFEFLGAMLGGSSVAATIQSITNLPIRPNMLPLLASGLLAAVIWNVFTRILRLPSSSTHALIGGMVGGVIAGSGTTKYVVWGQFGDIVNATGVARVAVSLFLSPVIGFLFGYACLRLIYALLIRASTRVNRRLKELQWLTVACLAFGHGANDTQKAMGILILSLQAVGLWHENYIPWWIRVAVGLAMALGIVSLAPGIVKRVGSGIYK
jgi:inorganic phosphate transporter, PiT family